MAYHSTDFDSALVRAAGDDIALQQELRAAFAESVRRQVDLLGRARCDANWMATIDRIHALAASFHAHELMQLVEEARRSAPGEPTVLRAIQGFVDGLAQRKRHDTGLAAEAPSP